MSNFDTFPVHTLKWFVYVGNGNVGPMSAEQLREGYLSKTYTPQHYVWSQVMKDWQPMNSIPELMSYLSSVPNLAPPTLELDTPISASVSGEESLEGTGTNSQGASPEIEIEEIRVDIPQSAEEKSEEIASTASIVPDPVPHNDTVGSDAGVAKDSDIPASPFENDLEEKMMAATPEKPVEETTKTSTHIYGEVPAAASGTKKIQPVVKNRRNLWIGTGFLAIGMALVVAGIFVWWKKTKELPQAGGSPAAIQMNNSGAQIAGTASALNWSELKLKSLRIMPFLSKWLSPVPELKDLSPEDLQRLKSAILQSLDQGPVVELAVSTQDQNRPSLYLGSNLPDKTELLVHIVGNPETLLGTFSFQKTIPAVLTGGLAKTSAISQNNGSPLTAGEYAVVITESPVQPESVKTAMAALKPAAIPSQISTKEFLMSPQNNAGIPQGVSDLSNKKVISVGFFFFGGTKDTTYEARLKEFHDSFKTKFDADLQNIKQTISFLTSQWVDTNTKFDQLKKQRSTKLGQKNWTKFHSTWTQMDQQLKAKVSLDTSPEALFSQTKVMLQGFANAVSAIHEAQNGFFVGQMDLKKVTEVLVELQQKAEVSQKAVAEKISAIDSAGQSDSGLPILPSGV